MYQVDLKNAKKPFYNLMMFPYPSAEGLHVGNMYAFTGADVYGRFKRMNGHDVFEPIGLDGFGIHSENYAIKVGRHPKKHAEISEENFYKQLSKIGNSFDWGHKLETYDPKYYRWTQWVFIQMFKAGLAYKSKAVVNWCPKDKTVLSDEQVEQGKCERCGTEVTRKTMSSWFFKITEYADRLLDNLKKIDWTQKVKTAQEQWIGRKPGSLVTFKLRVADNSKFEPNVQVFTTRLDTIFGVTFLVIAPEMAKEWIEKGWEASEETAFYTKEALSKSDQDRKAGEGDKTGVLTGLKAINPVSGEEVPVYIADYVLMGVGTGAVMGVPAHDERDEQFARKYDLPIKEVLGPGLESRMTFVLVNSGKYSGLSPKEATEKITNEYPKVVQNHTNYHLRDWGISRQRYWGPPIPMVFCKTCAEKSKSYFSSHSESISESILKQAQDDVNLHGWFPVPEDQLPVVLPDIEDFKPKGDGTSPLDNAPEEWKNTVCPECGGEAKRELDVSDTFLDSSWYFLAYPNLKTKEWEGGQTPFNAEITKRWLPVDAYIGGAEHAVLHLLYARFVWMVLHDQEFLPQSVGDEPFPFLFSHGLIIKDGSKMSKSKGNVINPDKYIEKFGVDAFRTYLMFLGPFEGGGDFRDSGIEGMKRFLNRVEKLFKDHDSVFPDAEQTKELLSKLNETTRKVSEDIKVFKYNTAIASIMELVNLMKDTRQASDRRESKISCAEWVGSLSVLAQLLAPFAPDISQKLWSKLRNDDNIHFSSWPEVNENLIVKEVVNIAVQVNGKLRATLEVSSGISGDKKKIEEQAKADHNVSKYIGDNQIKKTIFVKAKIINFVV